MGRARLLTGIGLLLAVLLAAAVAAAPAPQARAGARGSREKKTHHRQGYRWKGRRREERRRSRPRGRAHGSRIAYITKDADGYALYTVDPDGSDAKRSGLMPWGKRKKIGDIPYLDISRDGNRVAWWELAKDSKEGNISTLFTANSDGTGKKNLYTTQYDGRYIYLPDGKWVNFGAGTQVYRISSAGDAKEEALTGEGDLFIFPSVSPDGNSLIFVGMLKNEVIAEMAKQRITSLGDALAI